jgi:hypothetical protein
LGGDRGGRLGLHLGAVAECVLRRRRMVTRLVGAVVTGGWSRRSCPTSLPASYPAG